MGKFLFVLFLSIALHLTAAAHNSPLYASAKESRRAKKMSEGVPLQKDRHYWQDPRNGKKRQKTAKKKNCDCPGEMTAKQRRKYRFQ
jgi:hypothetical protein